MATRAKLYPYPVLTKEGNDYIDSNFDITYIVNFTEDEIILNIQAYLEDQELKELIENGLAAFSVRIECPPTCYREIITFNSFEKIVKIPASAVDIRLQIESFIVAIQDIDNYTNKNFNPEYGDIPFHLEKANILAVGSYVEIKVEKDSDDLANIPSIFLVIPRKDAESNDIIIDITGDLIKILVPSEEYKDFLNANRIEFYKPILHSILIIPSLIKALEEVKYNVESSEELEDKKWFRAIEKAVREKYKAKLDKEFLFSIETEQIAQRLMDYPINKSLSALLTLKNEEEDE